MTIVYWLLVGFALAALVPVGVLWLQVMFALPRWRERPLLTGPRPRVAVLVPAHNEASGIVATLSTILPQLSESDRLLVVADNCSDETAAIALSAGAEVAERRDSERRGKSYALDFGVRYLSDGAADVVIVVDADCQVVQGSIEWLARECEAVAGPVQALNQMRSPVGAGIKTHIAEFAWVVKNCVRPLGYHRMGLPCQLMGTGMAFPWSVIRDTDLASGNIVEDMKLGLDLARAGKLPRFCPEALVTSFFPATAEGIIAQRTRWEHGHLGIILAETPGLLADAVLRASPALLALALDLCVPSLSMLSLLVTVLTSLAAIFAVFGGGVLPLVLSIVVMAMLGMAVLLAWTRYGRQAVTLGDLAYAPIYALWKIPLYLKFLTGRQVEWVRAKRDGN